jgi:hypothetical protein
VFKERRRGSSLYGKASGKSGTHQNRHGEFAVAGADEKVVDWGRGRARIVSVRY